MEKVAVSTYGNNHAQGGSIVGYSSLLLSVVISATVDVVYSATLQCVILRRVHSCTCIAWWKEEALVTLDTTEKRRRN
ncbi:Hypothetical predicted protein, partial [Olea europaea subsp. europaea]